MFGVREQGSWAWGCLACAVGLAVGILGWPATAERARDRFDTVVIDAGHGGEDDGAQGAGGLAEKEVVLDVARRLAEQLQDAGLNVKLTRTDDTFVPLEVRTSVANDARGDLFISIHANSSPKRGPRGIETYFVALESSDAEAQRLAARENEAFGASGAAKRSEDPFTAMLGDMIVAEHVHESSEFSKLVQAELGGLSGARSRGVKQAPFVVLMGVQMPASLLEIGFLSNAGDEKLLRRDAHREALAEAVARAVLAFGKRYDARRGVGGGPAENTRGR